jgi:NIPSNAP
MSTKTLLSTCLLAAAVMVGYGVMKTNSAHAASSGRVFEMRTYITNDGKLDDLNARFRNHTITIFERHGMTSIGYWVPQEGPKRLVYIIAHESREAAAKNWEAFRADPEWQKVAKESEKNGKLVAKVESVFMDPTDYSMIK